MASAASNAQSTSKSDSSNQKSTFAQHPKGTWLLGVGATYIGLTAKGGAFATNRLWVGAEAEIHDLLTERREVGLFTRYYAGKGKAHLFVGTGVSYGAFKEFSWDIDDYTPPQTYHSVKLNALAGLEIHLNRRLSIEGVAKVGWLTQASGFLPSVQGSVNVLLGKVK